MQRAKKENLERNTAASHQLLNLLLLLNYRRLVVTNSQTEENVKLFNIWHNLHRIHKFPQSRFHNRQIHVTSVIFFNHMSLCSVNKLFSANVVQVQKTALFDVTKSTDATQRSWPPTSSQKSAPSCLRPPLPNTWQCTRRHRYEQEAVNRGLSKLQPPVWQGGV